MTSRGDERKRKNLTWFFEEGVKKARTPLLIDRFLHRNTHRARKSAFMRGFTAEQKRMMFKEVQVSEDIFKAILKTRLFK